MLAGLQHKQYIFRRPFFSFFSFAAFTRIHCACDNITPFFNCTDTKSKISAWKDFILFTINILSIFYGSLHNDYIKLHLFLLKELKGSFLNRSKLHGAYHHKTAFLFYCNFRVLFFWFCSQSLIVFFSLMHILWSPLGLRSYGSQLLPLPHHME